VKLDLSLIIRLHYV